ncbi:MAG: hypothetical protein CMP95_09405 [Gammaproteobacteria bacterium]|nr:hypothetical protein [Gammaproteobacteria bacterium]OUV67435.1 MAG: hypothetical protein CBC93_05275 [Gammaproteobacteria bacterium TMED133]
MDQVSLGSNLIITDVVAQPVKALGQSVEPGQSVYALRLNPPDARSLGLREGQTVNAVIENRSDGNILHLNKNIAVKLPFQVPFSGLLQPKVRMESLANGILSFLFMKKPDVNDRLVLDPSARLARLLSKGSNTGSLELLLKSDSFLAGTARDLQASLNPFSLRDSWFRRFDYSAIYSSLLKSGLFHEKDLREGKVSFPNLKELLLRLVKNSSLERSELLFISSAIEDIESSQLESLGHQLNRASQYHWLIPVFGEWPIDVQLFSEADSENDDSDENIFQWKVVIQVKVNEKESIDLSALFTETEVLSLYVGMPNEELAVLADSHKNWLLSEIEKIGISIDEFKVFQKEDASSSNKHIGYASNSNEKRWIADA